MSSAEFAIAIHDLDSAGKHFELPIRAPWIRGSLEGTGISTAESDGDGLLDVRLSKSGTDVVVRGVLTAPLTVPCARCLEPARIVIREELSALVVPGAPAASTSDSGSSDDESEGDDVAGDPNVITYDGETVVLDDFVRDELLLAVPMIPLCSEGCPGIRPEPAPEVPVEGIDPRLAPLLKLKSKAAKT